jgi:two-component system KDP operon response regulator KdpE
MRDIGKINPRRLYSRRIHSSHWLNTDAPGLYGFPHTAILLCRLYFQSHLCFPGEIQLKPQEGDIMIEPAVLIVDDEKSIRDFVQKNLDVRGFRVVIASHGLEALDLFHSQNIDLVIMDIMMPHMDGLEATKQIRRFSTVPIIILTALGEEIDKVKAFDLGADDYLTKPFGVGELLARVKAVLRRSRWSDVTIQPGKIQQGDIVVNLDRHEVMVSKSQIELTPTEFNLLVYLMKNTGKVLTHRVILQNVWGPEYGDEHEYLRVYIGHLRQKIELDPSKPQYIITKRGIGYSFEVE